MDDVRAVMDAAGSHHAVLLGVSEGGAMSIMFSATYPERTLRSCFTAHSLSTDTAGPEKPAMKSTRVWERWSELGEREGPRNSWRPARHRMKPMFATGLASSA